MAWKIGITLIIIVTCEWQKPRLIRNVMLAGGKRFASVTFVRIGALTAGDRTRATGDWGDRD
jgi:hypothetical protein